MPTRSDPPGCRSAAIATGVLVGLALVFMAIGLTLVNDRSCQAGCETLGLTLLYAGLPISAVFGMVSGDLVIAWPLDITLWVVLGFALARAADNRARNVLGAVLVAVLVALVYGLVLSQFVEIAM
ncbi:MAG TPA: hypothetical protein VJ948_12425 [Acidimicrobiia bacterium]|nr:hypothetical protein [Acidimicrobiia bacterium]